MSIDSSFQIIINPLIKSSQNPFVGESEISISADSLCQVYFTTNGNIPTLESNLYTKSFKIDKSTTIKAIAVQNNKASKTAIAYVHQLPHPNWKVILKSVYNKQYTAGGDAGIIDGLNGSADWRKGGWQGYQSQDFEVTIDLDEEKEISKISANFLQDSRSWILFPKSISFECSLDGKKFMAIGELKNEVLASDYSIATKSLHREFTPTKAKYVRIKAVNFGKLPAGHQGYGGDAFIFIDEININ
jgi:hypothetical protein